MKFNISPNIKDYIKASKEIILATLVFVLCIVAILDILGIPLKGTDFLLTPIEQKLNFLDIFTCFVAIIALIIALAAFMKTNLQSRPKCYIRDIRNDQSENRFLVCLDIIPGENETKICGIHVKNCLISTDRVKFEERLHLNHLYISQRMDGKNCTHVHFYLSVPEQYNNKVLDCYIYGSVMTFNIFFPLSYKIVPPKLKNIDKNFVSN